MESWNQAFGATEGAAKRSNSQLHCELRSGTVTERIPRSPVKRCDARSYLNQTLSVPSPSTSPHADPTAKNHVLQFTDSALSSSLPGKQPDEKVDLSLSVNLMTSGPTGRMSSIIEDALPKTDVRGRWVGFFSAGAGKAQCGGQARSLETAQLVCGPCTGRLMILYQNDTPLIIFHYLCSLVRQNNHIKL